ncbi:MAG: hypothetical protein K9H26_09700 [Prolixibacteraceae bacterium]|nr:hypothetical protein [Prolixibacteraceae bacterium]
MIRGTIIFVLFFSSLFALNRANAANNVERANNVDSFSAIDNLKVFIEGRHLDFNYIRSNIKFVDFVNDPLKADVHIIVTRKGTGGGGTNYVVNFYSKTVKQVGDFSLNCLTLPGDTDDTRREHITRTLKLGLMPFVNETANSPMVEILYNSDMQQPTEKMNEKDPWNKWVFRADINGGFGLEESIRDYNYSFRVRADRISEHIKFKNHFYLGNSFHEVESDGQTLISKNDTKSADAQTVYSLSKKWSAGIFLSYFHSTYWNTQNSFGAKPAIEYNIFPWEEADKRVFTISYFIGLEAKDYIETTIFNKTSENLFAQNLQFDLELIQPWGEIDARLEGMAYLHDLSKNSISFRSSLSVRITRGLSVNFRFRAENIHNQLYLPAQELSMEDILLGNQKLPSTFDLSGSVGLRIQFGSLYNNVVNNRL